VRVSSRWGTFLPNLGTLGFWILELVAMYATDGRTDKSNAYCPLPYGRRHSNDDDDDDDDDDNDNNDNKATMPYVCGSTAPKIETY